MSEPEQAVTGAIGSRAAARTTIGRAIAAATTLALAACASTPLPPWPASRMGATEPTPAAQAPTGASPVVVVPAPAPPAPAPTTPAPITAPITAPIAAPIAAPTAAPIAAPAPSSANSGPPLPVPPPMSPAVVARFPEPALTFATPAFAAGRQAFTHSGEIADLLYGIERANAMVASRRTEVRVLGLGSSQSGQPLQAIVFSRLPTPDATPGTTATPPRRPSVLLVAGQHGDEPAGTEALLVVAQELAAGRLDTALASVDVVLVPLANPDGAALFQRAAADGTDVNRDHLLLRTPEAQALARLQVDFAPIVVLDLHEYPVGGAFVEKFNAVQRFDALFQYAAVANLPPFITRAAEEWFRLPLLAGLRSAGLSADWYATTSADPADRKLSMGSVAPHVGRNAAGLRNSVSLLVETRGGGLGRVDIKRRVQTQLVAATSVLASAAAHAADLVKLRQFVDRDVAARACRGEAVLEATSTPSEYVLSVLDRESGAIRRIDVAWESALALRPLKSRARPCGYWLAAGETEAVRHLRLLGVEVMQLDAGAELRGETYREIARQPVGSEATHAGAATRVVVQTVPALLEIAAGGYYVSLEQPLANLAIAALEPEAPASFTANRLGGGVAGLARILQRPDVRMVGVP